MLSILIPTYNYNIFPLVSEIYNQCRDCSLEFEIVCLDDASNQFVSENEKIKKYNNTTYEVLKSNIGRSKIRNLLANKSKYNWLLFLDADVVPNSNHFIKNYLTFIDNEIKIVNGGLLYQKEAPQKNKMLRWVYGKNREALPVETRLKNPYLSFLTLNFLIHKSIFDKVIFNESIPNLRHEDTLFSYNLSQNNIKIVHIDNPIIHLGLEDFEVAIKKENQSLEALLFLLNHKLLDANYLKISKLYKKLVSIRLNIMIGYLFKIFKSLFLRNLSSKNPSLFVFDLYRIGYLCSQKI
jgi:hypothetical protein